MFYFIFSSTHYLRLLTSLPTMDMWNFIYYQELRISKVRKIIISYCNRKCWSYTQKGQNKIDLNLTQIAVQFQCWSRPHTPMNLSPAYTMLATSITKTPKYAWLAWYFYQLHSHQVIDSLQGWLYSTIHPFICIYQTRKSLVLHIELDCYKTAATVHQN